MPVAGYGSRDGQQLEATVIGVVGDVRYVTAADSSQPEVYCSVPPDGGPPSGPDSHASGERPQCGGVDTATLRSLLREADDRLVAEAVMPLEQRMLTTLARPRLYAVLLAGFAGFALVIAGVGLFGVLSYLGVPAVARAGDPRGAGRAQVGHLPARPAAGARRHASRARSGPRRIDVADAPAGDPALRRHAARHADVRARPVGAAVRERRWHASFRRGAQRGSIRCGCCAEGSRVPSGVHCHAKPLQEEERKGGWRGCLPVRQSWQCARAAHSSAALAAPCARAARQHAHSRPGKFLSVLPSSLLLFGFSGFTPVLPRRESWWASV